MSEDASNSVYALSKTTISKLCCASLAYQASKTLQLVRLQQIRRAVPSDRTNLASLPTEIFQHILSFARIYVEGNCQDTCPYMQLCHCVQPKTVWSKQITAEAFDKWAWEQHRFSQASTVDSVAANARDVLLSRLYTEFELSADWEEVLVPIKMEAYYNCHKCQRRWINVWLHLSQRRNVDDKQAIAAKSLIDTFLSDHAILIPDSDNTENWNYIDVTEMSEDEVQTYKICLVTAAYPKNVSASPSFNHDQQHESDVEKRLLPGFLAFRRFAAGYGLVSKAVAQGIKLREVDSASSSEEDEGEEDGQGEESSSESESEGEGGGGGGGEGSEESSSSSSSSSEEEGGEQEQV